MTNWGTVIKAGSVGLVIFAAGIGIGHLIEKSKIDNLKEQVNSLQESNTRLLQLLENHEQLIERLVIKDKISSIDNLNLFNDDEHMRIAFEYALKEYAEIYIAFCKGELVSQSDREFFNNVDDLIEGRDIEDDKIKLVIDRVTKKHGYKMNCHIKPYYGFIVGEIKDISDN